ncbi:hypothetical protein [Humibacter antri]
MAPIVEVVEASAPLPRLAEEKVFELVHTRISAAIGEGGEWVVRRRTPNDTDDLFRAVLAHQVALDVTSALRSAQLQLEAGQDLTVATREHAVALRSEVQMDETAAPSYPVERTDDDRDGVAVPSALHETTPAPDDEAEAVPTTVAAVDDTHDIEDSEHGPAHRHDEPYGDDAAVLDEDAIALQWEPAPITVWTDLKKPVTDSIALQLSQV